MRQWAAQALTERGLGAPLTAGQLRQLLTYRWGLLFNKAFTIPGQCGGKVASWVIRVEPLMEARVVPNRTPLAALRPAGRHAC